MAVMEEGRVQFHLLLCHFIAVDPERSHVIIEVQDFYPSVGTADDKCQSLTHIVFVVLIITIIVIINTFFKN